MNIKSRLTKKKFGLFRSKHTFYYLLKNTKNSRGLKMSWNKRWKRIGFVCSSLAFVGREDVSRRNLGFSTKQPKTVSTKINQTSQPKAHKNASHINLRFGYFSHKKGESNVGINYGQSKRECSMVWWDRITPHILEGW